MEIRNPDAHYLKEAEERMKQTEAARRASRRARRNGPVTVRRPKLAVPEEFPTDEPLIRVKPRVKGGEVQR